MTLAAQVRRLLSGSRPPGGVLIWWGSRDLPTGSGEAPVLAQPAWEGTYLRLENGARAPGAVRPLPEVLAATRAFRPDDPLPIAIASFRYGVPCAEIATRVRRAAAEGRPLRDPPRTLELDEREAFFACGLLHDQWGLSQATYRGHSVPFLVREDFHLTEPGGPLPDAVELDPGDGGGFRPVAMGTPLVAEYGEDATGAQVTVRCRYGSQVREARFAVSLSAEPAAPVPDEVWPLRADNGNSGTAWVYLADGASAVRRPLIMVEGFPGGHPADYLYDTLDQQGTTAALRAAGRDVVIVGLDQGMDEVQRNAEVLMACIREAIGRTHEPLVVGGMSMGGLVSRYALAAMEARGEPHNTDTFLTIDTPHAGTYTSLAAQWFVQTFLPFLPALGGYAQLLDSPANQQFDLWWLHGGIVRTSPLREAFVRELAALGDYPKLPRLLAVSSGRGDGARGAPASAQTLAWSGHPWISAELRALADGAQETIGQGTWFLAEPPELAPLRFDAGVAWEGVPGGQEPYNGDVATVAAGVGCGTVVHALDSTCTVPTVSALDLRQDPYAPVPPPGSGASPFADYAFCTSNLQHLTITAELSAWILAALGSPVPTPAGEVHG